jgi:hypothetical protein
MQQQHQSFHRLSGGVIHEKAGCGFDAIHRYREAAISVSLWLGRFPSLACALKALEAPARPRR